MGKKETGFEQLKSRDFPKKPLVIDGIFEIVCNLQIPNLEKDRENYHIVFSSKNEYTAVGGC